MLNKYTTKIRRVRRAYLIGRCTILGELDGRIRPYCTKIWGRRGLSNTGGLSIINPNLTLSCIVICIYMHVCHCI